jgi:hypothetical protein
MELCKCSNYVWQFWRCGQLHCAICKLPKEQHECNVGVD